MKKIYTTLVLIIGLNIVSPFGFSQNNQIKIEFIGNASLYMTDGNLHVYVDFPYKSGAHNYMEYDESQVDRIQEDAIVIFTHRHTDHYSKKLLNNIKGKVYGNWNTETLNELNNSVEGFSVKAIKTPHKFTTKHYSYVITWHNKKIYISGDTGDLEEVSKIKDIDWAFINPWLFMNAQNEKVTIDAKMFGIYHLYPDQKVPEERPDNIVFLKEQNKILLLPY
tara:strand:+ start:49302 stop:49967 length:666 start_codon:yes stop_codon:yes gene_type:complete